MLSKPPHHRRSIRLPGYDYTSAGAYFVTIVTHQREYLFGEIVNDEMHLNSLGLTAAEEWFKTAEIRENVDCFEEDFIVMPNHIHGIIHLANRGLVSNEKQRPLESFGKPVVASLPTIIRSYKSAVTKRINQLRNTPGAPVFQRNYYEHIIGTDREYESAVDYILSNPLKWAFDKENRLNS